MLIDFFDSIFIPLTVLGSEYLENFGNLRLFKAIFVPIVFLTIFLWLITYYITLEI